MVSPELLRRYSFFSDLSYDHIVTLSKEADELSVPSGHYFFRENDELNFLYLVLKGEVAIEIDLPRQDMTYKLSEVMAREFETEDVTVITIGPGEVFGWSALVSPRNATSSAKALTTSNLIAFDGRQMQKHFEADYQFGYLILQKTAQVIRSRLRQMRNQSLASVIVS